MKKVLLLSTLFICLQLSASAQLRFGITGGLQSANIHASARGTGASLSLNSLFGIHIGGVAEYTVNDNFFIQSGLMLSMKGASERSGGDSYTLRLNYLELPIMGLYKYEVGSGKLIAGVGPYFGFLLGGKDDGEPIKVGTDIKGFDAGIRLQGGYELTDKNLGINLFYSAGVANIYPSSTATIRNSTIGLSVTYFFGER